MTKRRCKVVYYRDRKKEYRWKFIGANGEQICKSSEGYKRKIDCEKSFHIVRFEECDIERTW